MVNRTVHQFNVPIRVRNGERIRHEVSFRGASASFAITSVPPGNLLLNQDDPGPVWRREWRRPGDPADPNPVHAIVMAFIQAVSYRWQVFHVDGAGNQTLEVDVEYSVNAPTGENTNDAVPIVG